METGPTECGVSDVYIACLHDVHGWGGSISAADGLAHACSQRGLGTLTLGVSSARDLPPTVGQPTRCNVHIQPAAGTWRVRHWRLAGLLARQLRRMPPPRVAFLSNSAFWTIAARRAWRHVPVIYRFPCLLSHCLPFTWPGARPPSFWTRVNFAATHRAEHLAFNLADRILVATAENYAEVLDFHPAAEQRLHQTRFGCRRFEVSDNQRVAAQTTLGLDQHAFLVAAIGVCDLNKAFERAITQWPAVHARGHLVIVGDGPRHRHLTQLAQRMNVVDRVHLVGSQRDIGPWYAAADCVVSTSSYDAFPNTIREAMAHGRPVIVPRNDPPRVYAGIAGLINREGGGLLYDLFEPNALATNINQLIASPSLTADLGAQALAVAARTFDWNPCVDELLDCGAGS
ncbi:MAG: glycosyltransferase family 4 protein [Planctomycetota bacterium]